MDTAKHFKELMRESLASRSGADVRTAFLHLGEDTPLRAAIARDILCKGRDRTRLVRVQRMATRNGKSYQTHVWVRPEKVRKGDVVVQGKDVYEKYLKDQKKAGQNAPGADDQKTAAEKPGTDPKSAERNGKPEKKKTAGAGTPADTKTAAGQAEEPLDASIAKTERERKLLELINRISDPEVLRTVANTGIVPEDEEAYGFVKDRLWKSYTDHVDVRSNERENTRNIVSSLRIPGCMDARHISTMLNGSRTALAGTEFAAFVSNPCEQLRITPGVHTGTRWGLYDIVGTLGNLNYILAHIAEEQPELEDECRAMMGEWMQMVKGQGLKKCYTASSSTGKKRSKKGREAYTETMGRMLRFFGMSVVDDHGVEVTDYGEQKHFGCMHYETKATPEREAVVMNILMAFKAVKACQSIRDAEASGAIPEWYSCDPEALGKFVFDTSGLVDHMPTFSLDFMRNAKRFRDSMPIQDSKDGVSVKECRARNCALRYVPEEETGRFFKDHPSPVKDAAYDILQHAMRFADGYAKPDPSERTMFEEKHIQSTTERYLPEEKPMGDLRADAFSRATCSIRTCGEAEQRQVFDKMESDHYTSIADNPKVRALFKKHKLITRRAYAVSNSKMEEAFRAKVESENLETHTAYNGISFEGMCGVCRSGAWRVPKDDAETGSGAMLGYGIYEAYTPYKCMMYAGSRPFSAVFENYNGTENYTDGFVADGVISILQSTYGKTHREFSDVGEANMANRNSGGDCDAVICRAADVPGLHADEACLSSADMMYPTVFVDCGARTLEEEL